jgi:hypothetical protein
MRDNALYFPYISVPDTAWFTRILLYWDKVSSIVPYDIASSPNQLSSYMKELVDVELVQPVFPANYIYSIPKFERPFLIYIHEKHNQLKRRKTQPTKLPRIRLHFEKIETITDDLVKLGLAELDTYPWYEVEAWVANAFMAYLAMTLGKLKEINAAPITDDYESFRLLGGNARSRTSQQRRTKAREIVLESILPSPNQPVKVNDLVKFKDKHGHLLQSFRNVVESACIEISSIEDPEMMEEKAQYTIKELQGSINEITCVMKDRWHKVTFATLIPLLGAGVSLLATPLNPPLAFTGASLSLTGAVYQAFANEKQYKEALAQPLAYATRSTLML